MATFVGRIFKPLWQREPECPEVRSQASAYMEGTLPQSKVLRLRRHLERCGPCRTFLQTLKATIGMLKGLPRQEVSPSLKESIVQQTRRGQGNRDSRG